MRNEGWDDSYDSLQKIFHEPHRLAIMSTLCAEADGLSFTELKSACNLTDGNLSRHLKAMEDGEVITIEKTFVSRRPRTTVHASERGRESFLVYLDALEEVLHKAVEAVQGQEHEIDAASIAHAVPSV